MATAIYRRRRFPWSTVVLGVFVVVLLVFVALVSGAKIPLPFTDTVLAWNQAEEEKDEEEVLPEGMVWVLRAARDIPAYRSIDNDDVLEVRQGKVGFAKYAWKADSVEENGLFTVDRLKDLKGRVLKRNKDKGRLFAESDFFEKGTKAGVTAGIPVGFQGLWVGVNEIEGLASLSRDDLFDIFAVVPRDEKKKRDMNSMLDGIHKTREEMMLNNRADEPKAKVEMIVSNGRVVTGVQVRSELETSSSLMSGSRTKATPKQEIFIAVRREEVPNLVEKLGMNITVYCLPHSGRGEARDGEPLPPPATTASLDEDDPEGDEEETPAYDFVEVIRGDVRSLETTIVPEGS